MANAIEPLFYPLGLCWLVLAATSLALLYKRRWRESWLPAGLAVGLSVFGGTPVSAMLLASLERPYANGRLAELAPADVVVMLGGLLRASSNDVFQADFQASVDRIITAAELVRRGKARVLVLGGGHPRGTAEGVIESDLALPWLQAWGIEPDAALQLGPCRNTRDEGVAFQRLLEQHRWQRVILVTSASHMRRGEGVFRALGIDVECVAADFRGTSAVSGGQTWDIIPTSGNFELLESYLHEVAGWWIYRWRGWVP